MSEIPKERNRGDDMELLRVATTLGQHVDSLTAEVRDLYHQWVVADWHRMKAAVGDPLPIRLQMLTDRANEAKAKYEARFTYREERIASNADYIREKVRNER